MAKTKKPLLRWIFEYVAFDWNNHDSDTDYPSTFEVYASNKRDALDIGKAKFLYRYANRYQDATFHGLKGYSDPIVIGQDVIADGARVWSKKDIYVKRDISLDEHSEGYKTVHPVELDKKNFVRYCEGELFNF